MRLLKIEIEGITSLKEKTIIDFEHDLESEDLFGITGPTGSGKSTILNSIAIALFYKSHKDLNPEDFVSLGAKRGKISLDFEMNGDKYTSKWECALYGVRGGRLKDPKPIKEFYKNGESLDLKKITPEMVIGLDEDQFQKTVIINQGKFSDFITSSFKDRKILLEKIYTSENITGFPSYLNKEISKLNDQKALYESTLKGGLPITEEQFKDNIEREKAISYELVTLEKQFSYLEVLNQNLKEIVENASKINKSKIDLDKANQQLEIATKELIEKEAKSKSADNAYTKYESLLKKELPEIEKGELLQNEINQCKKQIENKEHKNKQNDTHFKNEVEKIEKIKIEINKLQEKLETSKEGVTKILDSEEITKAESSIQKITVQLNQLENIKHQISETNNKLVESKEKGLKLKKEEESLVSKLNIKDSDIETVIECKNKELESYETNLTKLRLDIEKSKEYFEKIEANLIEINTLESKIADIQISKSEISKKLEFCLKEIELINKEISINENIIAINRCIEVAEENEKCPVCDNTDLSNLHNISSKIGNIDSLQEKLEILSQDKIRLHTEIKEIELKTNRAKQDLEKHKKEIKDFHSTISTIADSYLIKTDSRDEIPSLLNTELSKKRQKIESHKSDINTLRNSKSELMLVRQKTQSERDQYISHKNEVEKYETALSSTKKEHEEEKLNLQKTTGLEFKSIDITKMIIDSSRKLQKLFELIENNEKLLSNHQEQRNRIKSQIKDIESEIRDSKEELKNKSSQLVNIQTKYKTVDFKSLKDSKQKKLKEFQVEKDSAMKELHTAQMKKGELNTKIEWKEENINDLGNHVLRYLNNLQNRPDLNSPTKELEEIDQKIQKISLHETAHFEEWEIENINGFYDDVVQYHYQSIKEKTAELKEEAVEIRTINKTYKSKVDEFNKIAQEIAKIDQKLVTKLKVKDVIGRDEFTRYAISMIEEQLILMANTELEKLCDGRYILFQQEKNKTKGPEFFIKDLWRSSSERPLQSLSGGETFMVSLAMALGLAEMSRGQTEIDTFFIDEGFGTLDQDSLEEVLNILMSIRSRGKQIGIISHVKELTDRLPIRIQLQKNQLGESQVEISTI